MRGVNSAQQLRRPICMGPRILRYDFFVPERAFMHKGIIFGLLLCSAALVHPATAVGQFSPASVSATSIPSGHLIQVPELVKLLQSGQQQPLVLQVGSHIFFAEAHIKGSRYAGPGSQPAGLTLLENTVASLPKDHYIVLYCGCCPWDKCPNVGPAFQRLKTLGYSNVKVLYLANNFGDDWVARGYPTDRGK